MKILISGASGLIGKELIKLLFLENHDLWTLVRKDADIHKKEIFWDPEKRFLNPQSIEGFDAVINLNGENITGKRWTAAFKKKLIDSRVKTTEFISDTINGLKNPPKILLSASAIGFYGDRKDETLTEESTPGKGFLPELSLEWESAANKAKVERKVILRTGIVISKKGGALKKMLLPFKLGLGGRLSDGKHYISWISLEDECRAIIFCLNNEKISGPVNLTAPNAVTNEEFTQILAKAVHRPAIFPVPRFILKILFGDMADQALLSSANVKPLLLNLNDFSFNHRYLDQAINSALK